MGEHEARGLARAELRTAASCHLLSDLARHPACRDRRDSDPRRDVSCPETRRNESGIDRDTCQLRVERRHESTEQHRVLLVSGRHGEGELDEAAVEHRVHRATPYGGHRSVCGGPAVHSVVEIERVGRAQPVTRLEERCQGGKCTLARLGPERRIESCWLDRLVGEDPPFREPLDQPWRRLRIRWLSGVVEATRDLSAEARQPVPLIQPCLDEQERRQRHRAGLVLERSRSCECERRVPPTASERARPGDASRDGGRIGQPDGGDHDVRVRLFPESQGTKAASLLRRDGARGESENRALRSAAGRCPDDPPDSSTAKL